MHRIEIGSFSVLWHVLLPRQTTAIRTPAPGCMYVCTYIMKKCILFGSLDITTSPRLVGFLALGFSHRAPRPVCSPHLRVKFDKINALLMMETAISSILPDISQLRASTPRWCGETHGKWAWHSTRRAATGRATTFRPATNFFTCAFIYVCTLSHK